MKKHYSLGPSGAPAWSLCAAKPTRETGLPDSRSEHAAWGTVSHDLSERALTTPDGLCFLARGGEVASTVRETRGWWAVVTQAGDVTYAPPSAAVNHASDEIAVLVDAEMLDCVETYVGIVNGLPGEKHIETRVPIDHVTGEEGGSGTADCVAIDWPRRHMYVVDLKGGQGVRVDAFDEVVDLVTGEITRRPNLQLALYAAGALRKYDPDRRVATVGLMVVQPRLHHVSEITITRAELDALMAWLAERAEATRAPNPVAVPGEKQCRFCRARATCPELQAEVFAAALSDFEDLDAATRHEVTSVTASDALKVVPLVEAWCEAVRAQVYVDLAAGKADSNWKLVRGRRGPRKWADPANAEAALVTEIGYDEMFTRTLISPTAAERALKNTDAWDAICDLITQSPGAAIVAPITDRRPAIEAADVFADLTEEE